MNHIMCFRTFLELQTDLKRIMFWIILFLAAIPLPASNYYTEHPAEPFHSTTLQEYTPVQVVAAKFPGNVLWRMKKIPTIMKYKVPFSGKPGQPASHEGMDFVHHDAGVPHVSVHAVDDGTVAYVRTGCPQSSMFKHNTSLREAGAGWGNHIVLYHGNGVYSRYAHLFPGSIHLKVGDQVNAGDRIAEMGNTGRSETRHLHFEIGYKDSYFIPSKPSQGFKFVLNPEQFLPTDKRLEELSVEEPETLQKSISEDMQASAEPHASSSQSLLDDTDTADIILKQSGRDFSAFYKPVASWSGRLILPEKENRDPDGGVYIQLANAPDPSLRGKILKLRWNTDKAWDQWVNAIRYDLSIPKERKRDSLDAGLVLPTRLDGWEQVSNLESLAGARPEDDVQVLLKSPELSEGILYVNQEPSQVSGHQVALARFEGAAVGDLRKICHYNPHTGKFDGPVEWIHIPGTRIGKAGPSIPRTSTVGIEDSVLNAAGWYLYGNRKKGVFQARALAPRTLFQVKADQAVTGKKNSLEYFHKGHLTGLSRGLVRRSLVDPDPSRPGGWTVGKRGVVIHLFSWRRMHGAPSDGGQRLGITTGHMSFGLAEVIEDPFTGQPEFSIEYLQVYAHNVDGIISGTQTWHAYMGDLSRGWMYNLPVSDLIIQIPEVSPYDFGDGWIISPERGLAREMEKVMYRYRVGSGQGISSVRPDISCVQDSHCGVYSALRVFEETIARNGIVKKWLSQDPEAADRKRLCRFILLNRKIKNRITALGVAQGNWKQHFENPLATRDPNIAKVFLNTLLSWGTVFPRSGHDGMARIAVDMGYPIWAIASFQLGGDIPGLIAVPANSPGIRQPKSSADDEKLPLPPASCLQDMDD